jgi:hypothetical protein
MKKISLITFLGVLVLLVSSPYTYIGIWNEWKSYFIVVASITIIILSILIRKELHKVIKIAHEAGEVKTDTYIENKPQ